MMQRLSLVGQQFGSYRLLRLLGAGGFAEVYLGEHIDLGTQAAIKVLHTQLGPTDVDAFRAEARTIARLVHPHIIRVFDFNAAGSTPFLVMDYAIGGTMRERYPKGTIVPLDIIVSAIQQVADALQYAHDEKLIHRDIKPENILLDKRNNVLLSDFGIALVAQSSRYQNTQEVIGTAAYMSPEQIQGHPRAASDQYSLGIVVYEWLSGARPFEGSLTEVWSQHVFAPPPPLHKKVPTISPEIEQVVMTALNKDPKQRFDSVHAFAIALQRASQAGQAETVITPHPQINKTIAVSPSEHPSPIVSPYPYPQTNNPAPVRTSSDPRLRGSLKWSFATDRPVHSSPTVVDGTAYFGSHDGNFYAINTSYAHKIWSFHSGNQIDSLPAVTNDIVYFSSHDGNLYALHTSSGQKIWSFRSGNTVYSSPTVTKGVVYFSSYDGNLYAVHASSGQKIWSVHSGSGMIAPPTIVNGVVYVGSYDGSLYAVDALSGMQKQSFFIGNWVLSSAVVVNGIVYFGSKDSNLYSFDTTSGQKIWSFPTHSWVHSSPTVVNGTVYFGSDDHNLYALHATLGQQLWSFQTGGKIQSSPTVVNGIVYFGSDDHNLYAIDAVLGRKIWSIETGGKVRSSPTVVDDVVYVGSDDGKLYAIFA